MKLYWGVTGLFGVAMVAAGIFELTQPAQLTDTLDRLGFPHYALVLIGLGKIAGGVVVLIPQTDRLKEWAFAGFAVDFYGAIGSHVISGDTLEQTAPSMFVALFLAAAYFVWKKHGPRAEAAA
jgi:uncharacterized membrane protein YphA (DoxX/SURF4 family)